jgi:hypothetical protein
MRETAPPVRCACSSISSTRASSAVRFSNPVSGSSTARSRCSSSLSISAVITAVIAISRVSVEIRRVGSSTTPCASTTTDMPNIAAAVRAAPAITTWGRKRAADSATGSTIQGSAGLSSPPLSPAPTVSTPRITSPLSAIASSGRRELSMRPSAVNSTAALVANSRRNHQPMKGAIASRESPQVPVAIVRAVRTRAFASSARALWCSVGHSQELILSIPP